MRRKASSSHPLLFDLDGTVLDTLGDIAASANSVRHSFDLPDASASEVRDAIGDGLRELLRRLLPGDALDEAVARYNEHHRIQVGRDCVAYPGVVEGLEELGRRGHPMAIVSNKPECFCRDLVRLFEWQSVFPVVVGGDTAPERKPHPAPIELAAAQLGVDPRDCWMIGDSPSDLIAGEAAGCRMVVGVTYGYRSRSALAELGHGRLVDDFATLIELVVSADDCSAPTTE